MSDTLNLANSIWPNGMKVDSGHAVFYPLGTNKVEVPTSCTQWPKGNKLISPFVYQDDKLVGFVDTKALTVSGNTSIYLPYEHIEAEFSAINKGQLQIHAPNATTKKASWKDSGVEDIAEAQFKYKGCTTVDDVMEYYGDEDMIYHEHGFFTWSAPLWDLENGEGLFSTYSDMKEFSSDLPNLTNGSGMFERCSGLTSFSSDLSSLTDGTSMFGHCNNLTTFFSDLSSLTNGTEMFLMCENLTTFSSDLSSLVDGYYMFNYCNNLTTFTSNLSSLEDGL